MDIENRRTLNTERNRRIHTIIEKVVDVPCDKVEETVRSLCGTDGLVYQEVMSLLEHVESVEMTGFLTGPPCMTTPDDRASTIQETLFPDIPGYTILKLIGEGGMGQVFLAEQKTPVKRKVAIKLMMRGMNSREVLHRFHTEMLAMAALDHPNIARVFNTGTAEDGRPYFVMEHVPGIPITQYCIDRKLSINKRLGLFIKLCEAINHAHQKGIIHRDIKPTNILVFSQTGKPLLKIIDFGISKIADQRQGDAPFQTRYGQFIGTPSYMSPEQFDGISDIDIRSDVYSLGVTLYEILVESVPFDPDLIEKIGYTAYKSLIQKTIPKKPSTALKTPLHTSTLLHNENGNEGKALLKKLKTELDWIVLKALEKNPIRRYQSAAEFASDIKRFLNHEAVQACPPSVLYRTQKFVRKYRIQVISAVLIFVTLSAGLFSSSLLYKRAERFAQHVLDLSDFRIINDLKDREPGLLVNSEGKQDRIVEWITRAQEITERLEKHKRTLVELRKRAVKHMEAGASTWLFEDERTQWYHDLLAALIMDLERLADPRPIKGTIARVKLWKKRCLTESEIEERWKKTIEEIKHTKGISDRVALTRQKDLIPLGENTWGFWEFVHIKTGLPPEQKPDGSYSYDAYTGLLFVLAPGGEFMMGTEFSEEEKQHKVTLSPFFVSKYEVTREVWRNVMHKNVSYFPDEFTLPVVNVSWEDGREFCKKTGLALPSEAQWEYACRGFTDPNSRYSSPTLDPVAWYEGNSMLRSHPVGQKKSNGLGLHDVHGNISEWCLDRYNSRYYSTPEAAGPDPVCTDGTHRRITRGGSWRDIAEKCRCATRGHMIRTIHSDAHGFRPIRVLQN